ncbi:MBL fold metallo-hydrolase [Sphingobacterium faecale]|uniref:Exonuclease n=1 Tax=Sphingobacterium faecale TaxID=2803775 RepID=A0ABS1R9Z5_9SPHI|nr:MBL fold metallo-hydrolase [Sphingobacterium faecale]MBL1411130.1 exonuclease [Sphingobacterium faecale]
MLEIIDDFLVETALGYYCRYGDFYIDPKQPVRQAVVSHAHGDHAVPGSRQVYCTKATAKFMQYRFVRQVASIYHIQEFDASFDLNGVNITFIPAGHILGSAQILMVFKGIRYLYTGDYKLQEDATCEPIVYTKADVLITETTFADPNVIHPDPIEEIKKLGEQSSHIMLGCYALGKSQRLTHLLNTYCPEKKVFLHHSMLPLHRIYDELGFVKLNYEPYQRKALKEGKDKVYLVPPMTFNHYIRAKNVVRVFASGWKRLQFRNDLSLYISDHIDWADLLAYIEQVEPTEIWTVHGDGIHLREFYKDSMHVRNILKRI